MSIDDELLLDEEENRREVAYIREQLPDELKAKYTDDDLLWMTETAADYYFTSGVLEAEGDEVDIDLEAVARYVCQLAVQEGRAPLDVEEVLPVVEADLDFQEQSL